MKRVVIKLGYYRTIVWLRSLQIFLWFFACARKGLNNVKFQIIKSYRYNFGVKNCNSHNFYFERPAAAPEKSCVGSGSFCSNGKIYCKTLLIPDMGIVMREKLPSTSVGPPIEPWGKPGNSAPASALICLEKLLGNSLVSILSSGILSSTSLRSCFGSFSTVSLFPVWNTIN